MATHQHLEQSGVVGGGLHRQAVGAQDGGVRPVGHLHGVVARQLGQRLQALPALRLRATNQGDAPAEQAAIDGNAHGERAALPVLVGHGPEHVDRRLRSRQLDQRPVLHQFHGDRLQHIGAAGPGQRQGQQLLDIGRLEVDGGVLQMPDRVELISAYRAGNAEPRNSKNVPARDHHPPRGRVAGPVRSCRQNCLCASSIGVMPANCRLSPCACAPASLPAGLPA